MVLREGQKQGFRQVLMRGQRRCADDLFAHSKRVVVGRWPNPQDESRPLSPSRGRGEGEGAFSKQQMSNGDAIDSGYAM